MSLHRKEASLFVKENKLSKEESEKNVNISSTNIKKYELNNNVTMTSAASENTSQRSHMMKGLSEIQKDSMENCYPEKPSRERRKLDKRKTAKYRKNSPLYDERGVHKKSGQDYCDCLEIGCSGCHMPCPNCQSRKCGHQCRVNRKWIYDSAEHDDDVRKNPYK